MAYSKIKKRNLMLINNVTYQRETLSERPIRQPLRRLHGSRKQRQTVECCMVVHLYFIAFYGKRLLLVYLTMFSNKLQQMVIFESKGRIIHYYLNNKVIRYLFRVLYLQDVACEAITTSSFSVVLNPTR